MAITRYNIMTDKNNGGATDYYDFEESWKGCQDVIEAKEMNFA